eukprot:TRINITY_DN6072_c0_g3_i1.p1 TRINITY_DN6072_c0_g3~~TRINITY_DN6072_c0_g3_i1.p1  ORF type:complete len:1377 (+),score=363.05 TRINITY_DN6072_c0_g3_i1:122-4132(+)
MRSAQPAALALAALAGAAVGILPDEGDGPPPSVPAVPGGDSVWWRQEWTPPDDNPVYFLVGDNGLILRHSLSDAALPAPLWTRVAPPAALARDGSRLPNLYAVSASLTPKVGFAVGDNGTVLRTADGGHQWEVMENRLYRGSLRAVAEATTTDVYASGADGVVLRSGDSGKTWHVVRNRHTSELCPEQGGALWRPCELPYRPQRRLTSLASAALPTGASHRNLTNGSAQAYVLYAAGWDADADADPSGVSVIASWDEGRTWRRLYITASHAPAPAVLPAVFPVSVFADADGRILVAGADSRLYISTDWGMQWLKPEQPLLAGRGDWVEGCALWKGGQIVLCSGSGLGVARLVYGRAAPAEVLNSSINGTAPGGGPAAPRVGPPVHSGLPAGRVLVPPPLVSPALAGQSAVAIVAADLPAIAVSGDFGGSWIVVPLSARDVRLDDPAADERLVDPTTWRLRASTAVVVPPFPQCSSSRKKCPLMRQHSCPVGYFCPEEGLQYLCSLGSYCSGADSCEQACPGGHYCPTPSNISLCPPGHFCRAGSTKPSKCYWLAQCPAGTAVQNVMAFAWLLTAVLVASVVALVARIQQRFATAKGALLEELLGRVAALFDSQHGGAPGAAETPNVSTLPTLPVSINNSFRAGVTPPSTPVLGIISATPREEPFSADRCSGAPAACTIPLLLDDSGPPSSFGRRFMSSVSGRASESGAGSKTPPPRLDSSASAGGRTPPPSRTRRPAVPTPPIELRFDDLTITLRGSGKRLLNRVTGQIRPMSVTAVMGPSGAGKTTLLSALLGKSDVRTEQTGTIFVNGEPLTAERHRQLRDVVGFVPQEDTMHRDLSCREILSFNARLRLPDTVLDEDRRLWVATVIRSMRLSAETAQAPVGDEAQRGVSGGERKRINIGMEAVALPSLLFLDEPTSGLDATLCCHVIEMLRAIRDLCQCTVVAVIHQPRYEVFQLFDDVMLLGQGGSLCYCGPASAAEAYFFELGYVCQPKVNPADFLIDVVDDRVPSRDPELQGVRGPAAVAAALAQRWQERAPTSLRELPGPPALSECVTDGGRLRHTPGWFQQFWACFTRSLTQTYLRQWRTMATDLCLSVLGGCVLGIALKSGTYPDMHTLMGLSDFILCLFAHQAALRVFGKERVVFFREASSGCYSVSAYFVAKDVAQLPAVTAFPALYLALFYPLTEPLIDISTLFITQLLLVFVCYGSGYLHSVLLPHGSAQLAVVLTSFAFLVLSGFTPTLSSIWKGLPYIGWGLTTLSPIRWGFEAQLVGSFNQLAEFWRTCYADHFIYQAGYENNRRPLPTVGLNCVVLIALGLLVRLLAFVVMHCSARHRR